MSVGVEEFRAECNRQAVLSEQAWLVRHEAGSTVRQRNDTESQDPALRFQICNMRLFVQLGGDFASASEMSDACAMQVVWRNECSS